MQKAEKNLTLLPIRTAAVSAFANLAQSLFCETTQNRSGFGATR